jgi:uncharacterized membrane protein
LRVESAVGETRSVARPRSILAADAAISVLLVDADAERLEQMLAIAREARLLAYGARSAAVAVTMIARHDIDVVLVAADVERGRGGEVAIRAGWRCRCILIAVGATPDERERRRYERVVPWPFTAEVIGGVVASRPR